MEDVDVAQWGAVERGEFLAAVDAAGDAEPGVRCCGGGEVADEAGCLVETAVFELFSMLPPEKVQLDTHIRTLVGMKSNRRI